MPHLSKAGRARGPRNAKVEHTALALGARIRRRTRESQSGLRSLRDRKVQHAIDNVHSGCAAASMICHWLGKQRHRSRARVRDGR